LVSGGQELRKDTDVELKVAPASISLGPTAGEQAGVLEYAEVMGEQVRAHAELVLKIAR
jgi:hypothetical protein